MVKNLLRTIAFKILGRNQINYIRFSSFAKKISLLIKGKEPIGVYEPEMGILNKIIKNPEVCMDIGANYGSYTTILSKNFPNCRIFSFEPIDDSFSILSKIKEKFKLHNVSIFNIGMGDKMAKMLMKIPGGITGQAHLINNPMKKEQENIREVNIGTIDRFVERMNLKKVDFIKCDVEGVELKVFIGGLNTLKNLRPIILCEIEPRHMARYGIKPEETMVFLKNLGYMVFYLKGNKLFPTQEILESQPNYFLIPAEKIRN